MQTIVITIPWGVVAVLAVLLAGLLALAVILILRGSSRRRRRDSTDYIE
ncbi:MAG: hypothetical protein FWC72_06185 [Oscillospiraceae bacterium]|nr:hypothetical protein [Oscillospiraceae bacterium]